MDASRQQAQELRRQIEWTLARAVNPGDVLPMLHRLTRLADDGSDESLFANLHLAELLVERHPWRAALCARRVVAHRPDDDRGWATLGLCQTLLGNYTYAASAYHRALTSAPKNPWYAHNLGHLLDVALGRAADAVGWLKRAYQGAGESDEVAASYAHALARVGRIADARKVLVAVYERGGRLAAVPALLEIDQVARPGRPAGQGPPPSAPHAPAVGPRRRRASGSRGRRVRWAGPSRSGAGTAWRGRSVRVALGAAGRSGRARGRPRARPGEPAARRQAACSCSRTSRATTVARLAREARRPSGTRVASASVDAIAAGVAYAIVYVDHIPLTQAEVAACFRVSVANLRARFSELRTHLDLLPGDARYATFRQR